MRRRAIVLAGLATGIAAGVAWIRRTGQRRRDRVDLYYADGSMVSLGDGSADAERLLSLGREALRAVR